jgi:hypothetical protein
LSTIEGWSLSWGGGAYPALRTARQPQELIMHTPQLRNTLPVLAVAVLLGAVVVFGSHRAAPPIAVAAQDDFAGLIDIGDGRGRL